jgi:uncharacterized protein (DUF1501 family)
VEVLGELLGCLDGLFSLEPKLPALQAATASEQASVAASSETGRQLLANLMSVPP